MNILISLFLIVSFSFAKKDFYYSYIDENKKQMEQYKKSKISKGNDKLIYIKRLVREGRINDAYKDIIKFREENKIKILFSSVELIYADILYKRESKKFSIKASKLLKDAINKGTIRESDLLEALKLLVKIELKINKIKNAKYYAKAIVNSFDDPLSQAYGKIAQAQINIHRRKYKSAIKTLYKILVKTKNIEIATVVADELYDVYILDKQDKKAHELASKVLERNIEDVIQILQRYLDFNLVKNNNAIENAEKDYKKQSKNKEIENSIPLAWNKLLEEKDEFLSDIISEKVADLCGYEPDTKSIFKYLNELSYNSTNYQQPKSEKEVKNNNIKINHLKNEHSSDFKGVKFKGELPV